MCHKLNICLCQKWRLLGQNYLAEIFGRNNIWSNTKSDRECEWVRGGKEGRREEGLLFLLLSLLHPPSSRLGRSAACCPSPVSRGEGRAGGRAGGRDGWMDHYRLMLYVLARSHCRRGSQAGHGAGHGRAARAARAARMDTREKCAPTQNEFKKNHKRTPSCVCVCVSDSDLVLRSVRVRPRPPAPVRVSV